MKERMIYSPKNQKQDNQLDINFKKSPQKFVLYDSPQPTSELPIQNPLSESKYRRDPENIRKISDDVSSLRQTMNSRYSRYARANTLYDFQQQQEKPNKLNDFLRQTMSYRSTKAYSQKWASQLTNSNEVTLKKDNIYNPYKSQKNQDSYRLNESKSSSNFEKVSLEQYQKVHQKIDRNKKLIEELRKGSKGQSNYLKNLNYNRSPTYVNLDRQKQTDEKGFLKKKKEETANFMTPKVSKGTYDNRFNSSPLIEYSEPEEKPKQAAISMTNIPPIKRKTSISTSIKTTEPLDEYEIGKKLGEGKFGCVNLARHKKTLGLFALKKIPKAMIKSHMMVDQLALEIRLQSCLNHRNVLGMYGFFDDKTYLYIVLEYMDGGTLYEKLKKGKFSESETAFVIRQVTEAIENLHDMGIAHRDLKPENIVISNEIYKLCDFGWAAMCNQRRKTYCGTFDYVAPEILKGVQYDITVDLWCLGVMTFELMTGKAPFYHISRKETMKRILNVENETIQYPESMSETAKDFIDKLIRKNPVERMKASQALLHPFIKDVEIVNL